MCEDIMVNHGTPPNRNFSASWLSASAPGPPRSGRATYPTSRIHGKSANSSRKRRVSVRATHASITQSFAVAYMTL